MPRPDLLALSPDDLATLSNRGIVKRAQFELAESALKFEIEEGPDGAVALLWTDQVQCRFPAGGTLQNGRCTCPATSLCRHLIRSVLAYQQHHSGPAPAASAAAGQAAPAEEVPAWNPGRISDEVLAAAVSAPILKQAHAHWDEGQVVEATCSARPVATFRNSSCSLRFLVPDDPRYTHCDCAVPAPCVHVPLAVWAFRKLDEGRLSGVIVTGEPSLPVPHDLLQAIEQALLALAVQGVAAAPPPVVDRWRRLETQCRAAGLAWPAQIIAELVQQLEMYRGSNARFAPRRVGELVGELCIRCDAIGHATDAVPQLFVRGAGSDASTEVGAARLVGLGCEARSQRGGVDLSAFFQDSDSGSVVVMGRNFPDPPVDAREPPRQFSHLARSLLAAGVSYAAAGAGQLLVRGGKRSADAHFSLGRNPASFNLQGFAWDNLRAPLLVEDFENLHHRLAALPPSSLRPRRAGEDVVVCRVAGVERVEFSASEQIIHAELRDGHGHAAQLLHPFTSRGAEGAELLLQRLRQEPERLCFVAGHVRRTGADCTVQPISLVFGDAGSRTMLQPWVDTAGADSPASPAPPEPPVAAAASPVMADYFAQLAEALGEQLLLGLQRADAQTTGLWEGVLATGQSLGFLRALGSLESLTEALRLRANRSEWDPATAAEPLLCLAVLTLLGSELVGGER